MLGTAAFIFSGIAGYAGFPWWIAAITGFAVGAFIGGNRFYSSPWRFRFEGDDRERRAALQGLAFVVCWTGCISALLMTIIWAACRFILGR